MTSTFIILPATSPDDATYGFTPTAIDSKVGAGTVQVRFDRVVWYNAHHRALAYAQIARRQIPGRRILVGFSKSGLGAINLCLDHPGEFAAVLIFDSPLSLWLQPPSDIAAFYDQARWESDLPVLNLERIREMIGLTRLIHVGGRNFLDQHEAFDAALGSRSSSYRYFKEPDMVHHWSSGWLEKYVPEAL